MINPNIFIQATSLWQKATVDYTQMWFYASQVIWHRSAQVALGTMSHREATKMFFEKPVAYARAAEKAALARARGKGIAGSAVAAVGPLKTKTRSNASRLNRKKLRS